MGKQRTEWNEIRLECPLSNFQYKDDQSVLSIVNPNTSPKKKRAWKNTNSKCLNWSIKFLL